MKFSPYNSIAESPSLIYSKLNEKEISLIKKTTFCVTEKIHGSSFSILTDGKNVKFAKRTKILESNEQFFGYQKIKNKLEKNAIQLYFEVFNYFKNESDDLSIQIIGELFGGKYPNIVQEGIFYSNDLQYIPYDIICFSQFGETKYLPFEKFCEIIKLTDFDYLVPLCIGSYTLCNSYNPEFESKLYLKYDPNQNLNGKINYAEGIVIKPMTEFTTIDKRPIIKIKHELFKETHQLPIHKLQVSKVNNLNNLNNLNSLTDLFFGHINLNRVTSYFSKEGKFSSSTMHEATLSIFEDIFSTVRNEISFNLPTFNLIETIKYQCLDKIEEIIRDNFVVLED
jgi:Rnl2 family RNA ligase